MWPGKVLSLGVFDEFTLDSGHFSALDLRAGRLKLIGFQWTRPSFELRIRCRYYKRFWL